MALRHSDTGTDRYVLSAEEGHALFDREARRLVGVTGEEFLARWDAGEYQNLPESAETRRVMRVVHLIPFVRQQSR